MKFLMMILTDEEAARARSRAEIDATIARHGAVAKGLREAGKWVSSHRLAFSPEASTIRWRDGRPLCVDGPFAETKEQLGGTYLIEADSKEDAIAWAKRLPLAERGAIEVRPARTGATWRGAVRGARQFMVMFIADRQRPQSREAVFRAIDSHYELSLDLAEQGKFVDSRALEPPSTAVTLRRENGEHVLADGAFAETKEFVAGYFVIACDSREEALQWAERLMLGSEACEVRPLWG
jgi:hypothetical protein